MGNQSNEWVKNKIEQLRKELKCKHCGTRNRVEFAHIKPTELNGKGRGRKERYYDIIRHPECYKPLCPMCHRRFDHEKTK